MNRWRRGPSLALVLLATGSLLSAPSVEAGHDACPEIPHSSEQACVRVQPSSGRSGDDVTARGANWYSVARVSIYFQITGSSGRGEYVGCVQAQGESAAGCRGSWIGSDANKTYAWRFQIPFVVPSRSGGSYRVTAVQDPGEFGPVRTATTTFVVESEPGVTPTPGVVVTPPPTPTATPSSETRRETPSPPTRTRTRTRTPTLRIEPETGPPGFVAVAIGKGFRPGESVRLHWSPGIGTWTAGSRGSFRVHVMVFHRDTLGKRNLCALTTRFGDCEIRAGFLVVPASQQPRDFVFRG